MGRTTKLGVAKMGEMFPSQKNCWFTDTEELWYESNDKSPINDLWSIRGDYLEGSSVAFYPSGYVATGFCSSDATNGDFDNCKNTIPELADAINAQHDPSWNATSKFDDPTAPYTDKLKTQIITYVKCGKLKQLQSSLVSDLIRQDSSDK